MSSWTTNKKEFCHQASDIIIIADFSNIIQQNSISKYKNHIRTPNMRPLLSNLQMNSQQGQGNYGSGWSTAAVQTENIALAAKLCLRWSFSNTSSLRFRGWNMDANENGRLWDRNEGLSDVDGIEPERLTQSMLCLLWGHTNQLMNMQTLLLLYKRWDQTGCNLMTKPTAFWISEAKKH